MTVSAHEVGLDGLDTLSGVDSLCLFVSEDERPLKGASGYADWRMCGGLSNVLQRGFFSGAPGEWLLLPASGRLPVERIFVCGLGRNAQLGAKGVAEALASAGSTLARAKVRGVAMELPGSGRVEDPVRVAALLEQFLPPFGSGHVAVMGEKALTKLLPQR